MVFTLLETANKHFNNDFIIQQARLLDETETGIGKALYAAIPTILSGMITQVTGGAQLLTRQLLDNSAAPGGESLLDRLFNKQLGDVTRAVIHLSGIKSTSAYFILCAAAPAVFVTVREHAVARQLNAAQLVYLLHSLTTELTPTLPADMPVVTAVADAVPETPVITPIAPKLTIYVPTPPAEQAPVAIPPPIVTAPEPPVSKPQLVDEPEPEPTEAETQLPDEPEEPEEYAEDEAEVTSRRKRRRWITLTAVTAGALLAWYLFKGNCNTPH